MSGAERLGAGVSFERIRRITGYLVGTMEKWGSVIISLINPVSFQNRIYL